MDFSLSDEQQMIIKTTRDFVVNELYPHEAEIEETGVLRHDLRDALKKKAIEAGLYAANMPAEVGGAGLDTLTWVLYEKELGKANYALHWTCVARPSNILMACNAEQREKYLFPAIRGEAGDCLALTEPGIGSDLRGMKTFAKLYNMADVVAIDVGGTTTDIGQCLDGNTEQSCGARGAACIPCSSGQSCNGGACLVKTGNGDAGSTGGGGGAGAWEFSDHGEALCCAGNGGAGAEQGGGADALQCRDRCP